MEVKTCRRCKKLFNYVVGDVICPVCKEEEEKVFQDVKAYIRENNYVNENEILEKFDVTAKTIRQWIKDGRLEVKVGSSLALHCKRCGKAIASGDICEECKQKDMQNIVSLGASVRKEVKPLEVKKPEHTGNKMRFLNTDTKR